MNRKGQALIEFVLILPIFLMILFVIVDFGNLCYSKNELQNNSVDIIRMINNNDDLEQIKNTYKEVNIEIEDYKDNYERVLISKKIKLITPFLDRILGNPCLVEVERIIPDV